AALVRAGEGGGREGEVAPALEVDEALARGRPVLRVEGDRGDVEVAVAAEVPRAGLEGAVHGEEVGRLAEAVPAVVEEDADAVVRLGDGRVVPVVAVHVEDVEVAVAVEVGELEVGGAVRRREAQQGRLPELAAAGVLEE